VREELEASVVAEVTAVSSAMSLRLFRADKYYFILNSHAKVIRKSRISHHIHTYRMMAAS
jgi:hypothetical protein